MAKDMLTAIYEAEEASARRESEAKKRETAKSNMRTPPAGR